MGAIAKQSVSSTELDENLAKLDQFTRSQRDDFDNLTDRQFSTEDEADRNEMLMSKGRDNGIRSSSTFPNLSTSSMSSSIVEVATPTAVRDAMFASTFEEIQPVDEEEEEDKE